jgi:hypothetical protein
VLGRVLGRGAGYVSVSSPLPRWPPERRVAGAACAARVRGGVFGLPAGVSFRACLPGTGATLVDEGELPSFASRGSYWMTVG